MGIAPVPLAASWTWLWNALFLCRGQVGALAIATAHNRNEKRQTEQDQNDPGEGPAQIHGAMFPEFNMGTLSIKIEQAYEGHET
jgi:hypothetical protein